MVRILIGDVFAGNQVVGSRAVVRLLSDNGSKIVWRGQAHVDWKDALHEGRSWAAANGYEVSR